MKVILLIICFCFYQSMSFAQSSVTATKKFEKEIGIHFFAFYPSEYAPAPSLSLRRIITTSLQAGAGISEIYFRHRDAMYIPLYGDLQLAVGKNKKVTFNLKPGYGFFKERETGVYAWGPGNVVIKRTGGFYAGVGASYGFKLWTKSFKAGLNYMSASTNNNVFVESTKQSSNYRDRYTGMSVFLSYLF